MLKHEQAATLLRGFAVISKLPFLTWLEVSSPAIRVNQWAVSLGFYLLAAN